MSNIVRQLYYKINIVFFCWMIGHLNLYSGIQLDTTQWQEVDITNNFIDQSYKQDSGYSRYYDSLQLNQTQYVNLIRSSGTPSQILIQYLDEYGNQQCSKIISVVDSYKYSLTNTNVEGELFFAYTSKVGSIREVFFGFLDETCNFSRGLSAPDQPVQFTSTNYVSILAKNGKDYVYVLAQQFEDPLYYLYLITVDINDTSTYSIIRHEKLEEINFKWNLFSIQAFSDDYLVIFGRDNNDKLQKIIIEPNGNEIWDDPKDQGIFLSLNNDLNRIQNKVIQIQNSNKYTIVTGDYQQNILSIYTFLYNGNGEVQDVCQESYSNFFDNMGNQFFRALEFGVINPDFIWIKGDNQNQDKKTVVFFANPFNCKTYMNPNDGSIYQYQLEDFSYTHILRTYYSNQTVSLIVSSSYIDGSSSQILEAIRIDIGENCPRYCSSCIDFENCDSCVSANVQRNVNNQCLCPDKYYQDQSSDDCLECLQYCGTCIDSTTCQSCIISDGERDIFNQCQCQDSYYQDALSGDCLKCPLYCEICSDSNTCQTCISSVKERDVSNQCQCKDGYYQDTGSYDCLECPQYCLTCLDQMTCQICISSDGERDASNLCICKNGYYQDTGSDSCLGIQIYTDILIMYLLLLFQFKECPQYCEICSDLTTCQSCISSDGERDISNLCNCKNGYYQDSSSNNCLECPQYCKICSDSNTCQSCISSEGERDVSNLCACKDGYYQDTESDNCLSTLHFKYIDYQNFQLNYNDLNILDCPYYCQTCSDYNTCLSCIISDGIRDMSNICKCKDGYYQDIESDNCLGKLKQ
ncbi:Insulin-like growth factor binding protein, N-terminal [Pseudocohnilembus persalinus]|uniref:Insulin-like growth factor binding protein, N-terminal n=1 Tax=Pseudocohnilembus persalinus TaxID=266149 RepID=A0A0V0R626_PSEPJ|nr:Insulin-like growth factor binding protein, N-terminal [Pseudocohnilembus persalinus]|eukprot:KRX09958.1 Insulin-like growth factor binding protein, N-terminal [Pseudocohnilembus persalinus]